MTLPLVALESTVIAHGLPYPVNLETARRMEKAIEVAGATPRTIGIIGGQPVIGLSPEQLEHLARAEHVQKLSRRDLPVAIARGLDGATTVSTTMWLAHRAGIKIMATGGIGGVHRGDKAVGQGSFDISADLDELGRTSMAVVCAGPKAILDLEATREALETRGVTVIGYQTDEMPAFYSRTSGLPVDVRCNSIEETAAIVAARFNMGLQGSCLITAPIPEPAAIPMPELSPLIDAAADEAHALGLQAASITPFLLKKLALLSEEKTLQANITLLLNNARIAAELASCLAENHQL